MGLKFAKGARPTSEYKTVRALANHFLEKEHSDEEMAVLMAYRNKTPPTDAQEGLYMADPANLDLAAELCHPADASDVLALKAKFIKAAGSARAGHAASKPAAAAAAGPDDAAAAAPAPAALEPHAGPAKKKVSLKGSITPEAAKLLMPELKGVTISVHTVRHFRWKANYPAPPPDHYVGKGWGPKSDVCKEGALAYVLERIWAIHTRLTGVACPYEISAASVAHAAG